MAALREPSLSGAVAAQDEASAPPPRCAILSSRPASPLCGAPFFRLAAPSPPPRRFPLRVLEKTGYNRAEEIGVKLMVLTLGDLELLKQLRGAGGLGRNVRELNIRVTLDRLVKGGYLVGRPIDQRSVQYRITQRGQDAIVEHDF